MRAGKSRSLGSVAEFEEAAECLKTLSHPVRLQMLKLLMEARLTVGELAERCQIQQSVGSDHLRLLQRCGFLSNRREGRNVYYSIAEPALEKLMECISGGCLPCGKAGGP